MNKTGNVRSKATKQKINRALMYLLKHKDFGELYVKDICTIACINRSSFYEHYDDINDLMIKTESELSNSMAEIFKNPPYYTIENFVKMFEFIKQNKEFYSAHLKNFSDSIMVRSDFTAFIKQTNSSKAKYEFSENELIYHMAFFAAGITAVCKVWLETGLKETPGELAKIIEKEYSRNIKYIQKI